MVTPRKPGLLGLRFSRVTVQKGTDLVFWDWVTVWDCSDRHSLEIHGGFGSRHRSEASRRLLLAEGLSSVCEHLWSTVREAAVNSPFLWLSGRLCRNREPGERCVGYLLLGDRQP